MSALINNGDIVILTSALTFGFFSNLHCISMCGPLVYQSGKDMKSHGLYQIGRLISYLILGMSIFFLSNSLFKSLSLTLQKYSLYFLVIIYIYIGIGILLSKKNFNIFGKHFTKLYQTAFKKIKESKNKKLLNLFLGLISGLLPCGLLHTFLLGVISLDRPLLAFLYITSFWLATTPSLVGVSLSSRLIKKKLAFNSPILLGGTYILMGIFLIYMRHQTILSSAPSCH